MLRVKVFAYSKMSFAFASIWKMMGNAAYRYITRKTLVHWVFYVTLTVILFC